MSVWSYNILFKIWYLKKIFKYTYQQTFLLYVQYACIPNYRSTWPDIVKCSRCTCDRDLCQRETF